jgi:hypothetical protein
MRIETAGASRGGERMKRIAGAGLVVAVALFAGCSQQSGPRTMHVWGDVSLDGKPVEDGTITFDSTDGSPPAQGPIKGGHYDLAAESGPVAEKTYVVRINALAKTGKTVPNVMGDGAPTMDLMAETIPAAFNTQSTIRKTISAVPEKNQFSFQLRKAGGYE